MLGQLFERLRGEGFTMSFTMEDFEAELNTNLFEKRVHSENMVMQLPCYFLSQLDLVAFAA